MRWDLGWTCQQGWKLINGSQIRNLRWFPPTAARCNPQGEVGHLQHYACLSPTLPIWDVDATGLGWGPGISSFWKLPRWFDYAAGLVSHCAGERTLYSNHQPKAYWENWSHLDWFCNWLIHFFNIHRALSTCWSWLGTGDTEMNKRWSLLFQSSEQSQDVWSVLLGGGIWAGQESHQALQWDLEIYTQSPGPWCKRMNSIIHLESSGEMD